MFERGVLLVQLFFILRNVSFRTSTLPSTRVKQFHVLRLILIRTVVVRLNPLRSCFSRNSLESFIQSERAHKVNQISFEEEEPLFSSKRVSKFLNYSQSSRGEQTYTLNLRINIISTTSESIRFDKFVSIQSSIYN